MGLRSTGGIAWRSHFFSQENADSSLDSFRHPPPELKARRPPEPLDPASPLRQRLSRTCAGGGTTSGYQVPGLCPAMHAPATLLTAVCYSAVSWITARHFRRSHHAAFRA